MTTYRLFRGPDLLGTVTHLPEEAVDGSPWDIGLLDPSEEFEGYRAIFEAEQRLIDEAAALEPGLVSEKLFAAAESLQAEMMRQPVYLEGPDGAIPVKELHVQGDQVHWR